METTLVWTGVWTSVAVGMVLLVPVIVAFFQRNLPILLGILVLMGAFSYLSPNSPAIRQFWIFLGNLPFALAAALGQGLSQLLG